MYTSWKNSLPSPVYPQEALQFDSAKYRIEIDVVDNGQGVLTAQQPRIFRNDQPVDQILFENPIAAIPAVADALPFGTKELERQNTRRK